ncbi:MAG TPA: hypothetical protein PKA63_06480 [Oligoflexia bacterium]|nr:hypothetical protein [Oligoflexia bacterium]HMP48295.1 hypothetical protein [Oligoflexia bacterium]
MTFRNICSKIYIPKPDFKFALILAQSCILISLLSFTACSAPKVSVFDGNKLKTATGKVDKNSAEIERITKNCSEDKEEISNIVSKMNSLIANP